jgi:hypothetical protein
MVMKKIISKLFGSDNVINKGMEALDALVLTDQERSSRKLLFLKTYEAFKIAQRYALLLFTFPFVFIHLTATIAWLTAIFTIKDLERYELIVTEIHQLAHMNNVALGEPVTWIVAFYFLGGASEGAIKAFTTRFKK